MDKSLQEENIFLGLEAGNIHLKIKLMKFLVMITNVVLERPGIKADIHLKTVQIPCR